MSNLYEIAIIQNPTKKEIEEGTAMPKLVYGPEAFIAPNNQTAGMVAMQSPNIPKNLDLNRCDVVVRPFQ